MFTFIFDRSLWIRYNLQVIFSYFFSPSFFVLQHSGHHGDGCSISFRSLWSQHWSYESIHQ